MNDAEFLDAMGQKSDPSREELDRLCDLCFPGVKVIPYQFWKKHRRRFVVETSNKISRIVLERITS